MTTVTRWLTPTLPIAVLTTTFGAISGTVMGMAFPFAATGLIWALAIGPFAGRIADKGARSPSWANAPILIACPLAFLVLGGSLLGQTMSGTPEEALRLFQQAAFGNFFVTFHIVFEWILVPAMLILNWRHRSRRQMLLLLAVVFYLGRVCSALYFAPNALVWGAETAVSAQLLDDVSLWVNLNLIRLVLQDGLTAALLFVAVLRRPSAAASDLSRPTTTFVQPQH